MVQAACSHFKATLQLSLGGHGLFHSWLLLQPRYDKETWRLQSGKACGPVSRCIFFVLDIRAPFAWSPWHCRLQKVVQAKLMLVLLQNSWHLRSALEKAAETNLRVWTQLHLLGQPAFTTQDVDQLWAQHNRTSVRFRLHNGQWIMNGSADWCERLPC